MNYYCNPVNINYRYQFNQNQRTNGLEICREAADPSMILFQGKYYCFVSMNLSVWVSEDLVKWESHRLPENMPLYDYAPDVRVIGEYVYFSASRREENCSFYRTKDVLNGPFEEIEGSFSFWDPNLFCDDDGKVYFYWGCTNVDPIWGVELDLETMLPVGEKKALLYGDAYAKGYERVGIDHEEFPRQDAEIEAYFQGFLKESGRKEEEFPAALIPAIKGMFSRQPYIEGAWLDKYQGKYYLQYACPGTQYHTYADGVYVSDSPLGPYSLALNNPYSYKPGGFIPGAGHGSTMWDKAGNLWHTATLRISMNHLFERRVGIWPAGFDADGELFCDQRFGDWPQAVSGEKLEPWEDPEWFLLSYGKHVTASSSAPEHDPGNAADENVQTWWKAETNHLEEWIQIDLGSLVDVRAIQINFADDKIEMDPPGEIRGTTQARYIEERDLFTRWKLEGSQDGEAYFTIEDKTNAMTDLPHDLVVREEGMKVRYLRLSSIEVPYSQQPCISGLRVFGKGNGQVPAVPKYMAKRLSDLDMEINITKQENTTGFLILWGHTPEKLYHSYMVFGEDQKIGALVKDQDYFIRVDAFNENGITKGEVSTNLVRS
ncbi:MAG: family 43 glycosylhydrolase [Lachnospiraceae bacterium]